MRSLWLLSATLVAPFILASPVEAAFLPACCVSEPGTSPGDRSKPPHKELGEDTPGVLESETVRSPDERTLEASAEAPIPEESILTSAIGVPLDVPTVVPEPEPGTMPIVVPAPAPLGINGLINTTPCCQLQPIIPSEVEKSKPPHKHLEEEKAPLRILESEKVTSPDDRLLELSAEAPIPEEKTQLSPAIGTQLDVPPPYTRPERWTLPIVAKAMAAIVLLALLVVGFRLWSRRRRPSLELQPSPAWRALPPELRRAVLMPSAAAQRTKARNPERELEPA